jgi:hypothetical protein
VTPSPQTTARQFRAAVEAHDVDQMLAALDPDVRLYSPVAFRPFVGHGQVRVLFVNLLDVFEDFRYVDELSGDGTHALIFQTHVGVTQVQGLDHLRFGESGLVTEFTVMVRPLSAAVTLAQTLGPRLEHLPKG